MQADNSIVSKKPLYTQMYAINIFLMSKWMMNKKIEINSM